MSLGILNIGASDNDPAADTIRAGGRKLNLSAAVISRATAAPPGSPALGNLYIVPSGATGAWAGQTDKVAFYNGATWEFYTPAEGWRTWVSDENLMVVYTGAAWDDTILGGGSIAPSAPTEKTASYDVADGDLTGGQYHEANSASAITITVPSGLLNLGPLIVERVGTGTVTFVEGSGVTVQSKSGLLAIGSQFGAVTLVPKGSDRYSLIGDLA